MLQAKETLLLKFKVMGKLRYLSHRETMSVFERAIIRSGIDLYFTQGFNPRPKVSLPLPRSVGLASADDMFCAELICNGNSAESITEKMGAQLPDGIEITGVELMAGRVRPQAVKAAYGFTFAFAGANEALRERVEEVKCQIASGEEMFVTRTGGKQKMPRQINVLPFIDSLDYEGDELCVWCNISGGGTVRVGELVEVLQIDASELSEPITRKQVVYNV
jgi:radical SAM-linked protein